MDLYINQKHVISIMYLKVELQNLDNIHLPFSDDFLNSDVGQLREDIDNINSSLGGLSFGIDGEGNYGYIKEGADTVTPFKKDFDISGLSITLGAYNLNNVSVGTSIQKLPIPEGTKINLSSNSNLYCTIVAFDKDNNSTTIVNYYNLTSSITYDLTGYSFVSVDVSSRIGRGQTNTIISFSK